LSDVEAATFFWTIGSQVTLRLSALLCWPPFTPRKIPGTLFCWRLSRPQDSSATGKIRSIENSNDLIGNRTRHLTDCSIVSQPTTPQRAPLRGLIAYNIVTDLLKALLGKGSLNTFQHTHHTTIRWKCSLCGHLHATIRRKYFLCGPRHATL
jgi:hypothetical protein